MVRKILDAKDPYLRQVSKPVGAIDKKVEGLIRDLKDTLRIQKDPEGVGLAAPQIGKNVRIFYISHKGVSEILGNETERKQIMENVYNYSKNMTWDAVFDKVFLEMGITAR